MQNVVGAGVDVGVITEEGSAEAVTGVDVLSGHVVGGGGTQVADDVTAYRVAPVSAWDVCVSRRRVVAGE
jgi:hypothetical protein